MSLPIKVSASSLREGRWYEYVVRFGLGGAATVFTGLISSRYGASIGGLFLALPAIFCASATLIEKHEIRRKREARLEGGDEDGRPPRSMQPVPRLVPSVCSPSPQCSGSSSSGASQAHSSALRWPG